MASLSKWVFEKKKLLIALFLLILFVSGFALTVMIFNNLKFGPKQSNLKISTPEESKDESKFVDYTNELLQASAKSQGKPEDIQNLIEIAKKRKEEGLKEIESNPKTFLSYALPNEVRRKLPDEIQPLIENEIRVSGDIEVIHADIFEENKSTTKYTLNAKDVSYNIHIADYPPGLNVSPNVALQAIALDNELVIASGKDLAVKDSNVLGISQNNRILAILINFEDNPTVPPFAKENIEQTFREVDQYYKEVLANRFSFSADVHGWHTLSLPSTNTDNICTKDKNEYIKEATLKAFPGFSLNNPLNYNILFLIFPQISACKFEGGAIPTKNLILINGNNNPTVFIHELGHLLPFHHAAGIRCSNRAIENYQNCGYLEYGDPFDPMGNNLTILPSFNLPHHLEIGNLSSNVQKVSTSGNYTISPLGSLGGTKGLKINKPDTGEDYYIEYRQPISYDTSLPSPATEGVLIHTASGTTPPLPWFAGVTRLIDTTPTTPTLVDSSLADGRSLIDNINGITITQVSHDSSGATLSIIFERGLCSLTDPILNIYPKTRVGKEENPATYFLTITNYDSPVCNNSNFEIVFSPPNNKLMADGLPGIISLYPGETKSVEFSILEDPGLEIGSHKFTVYTKRSFAETIEVHDSANYVSYGATGKPYTTPSFDPNLPCATYDKNLKACDATEGKCAYYACSKTCRPKGTTLEEGCKPRGSEECTLESYSQEYSCSNGLRCFNDFDVDPNACEYVPRKNPPDGAHFHCDPDPLCGSQTPTPPSQALQSGIESTEDNEQNFFDQAQETFMDIYENIEDVIPILPDPPAEEDEVIPEEEEQAQPEPKTIVKVIVYGQEVDLDNLDNFVNVHLPGIEGQAEYISIPVEIHYSDSTSRYLVLNFNYNPPQAPPPPPPENPPDNCPNWQFYQNECTGCNQARSVERDDCSGEARISAYNVYDEGCASWCPQDSGNNCLTSCGIYNGENCTNQYKADTECADYYQDNSTCSFTDYGTRGDGCIP